MTTHYNIICALEQVPEFRAKTHDELTVDGRRHDKDKNGCLDAGTVITALEIKKVGKDIWIRCPSGWVAGVYNGEVYVK